MDEILVEVAEVVALVDEVMVAECVRHQTFDGVSLPALARCCGAN